jgi:hypothetical protein
VNKESNKDSFLAYVENTRDCDETRLNAAVSKGLRKAKNDRTDFRKLLMLAAASVFTLVMCFAVNLRPIKSAAEKYYQSRSAMMPGSAEVLEGYIKDITDTIERYLGGM